MYMSPFWAKRQYYGKTFLFMWNKYIHFHNAFYNPVGFRGYGEYITV